MWNDTDSRKEKTARNENYSYVGDSNAVRKNFRISMNIHKRVKKNIKTYFIICFGSTFFVRNINIFLSILLLVLKTYIFSQTKKIFEKL